jgi:hypothetical protein
MNLLLLQNIKACPSCRRLAVPKILPAVCRCCNVMLFRSSDNYERFQAETGVREYYVYNTLLGWMHSTQIKTPTPLSRDYTAPNLPDDYGTKTAEQRAQEVREAAKLT